MDTRTLKEILLASSIIALASFGGHMATEYTKVIDPSQILETGLVLNTY
jgi:hypothetical protein